jgi:hypothetical protein
MIRCGILFFLLSISGFVTAQSDKIILKEGSFLKGKIDSITTDSVYIRPAVSWGLSVPYSQIRYLHLGKRSKLDLPAEWVSRLKKEQQGHFHATTVGFLMGKTGYSDPIIDPVIHHVQGHRFSYRAALGLGVSGYFHSGAAIYPTYLHGQYTPWFLPERIVLTGNLGHGWIANRRESNDWQQWHRRGGLYRGLGFGLRAPVQGGYFLLQAAWSRQTMETTYSFNWFWGNNTTTEKRQINRLEISLGFMFRTKKKNL